MSVNRQFNPYSGMRFDVPHIRSIESSVVADFDTVLQGMITGLNQPFLIRGFDVVVPNASISASSLEIKVADSAVLHASASEAGTILTVAPTALNEVLNTQNTKVVGAFQNGVANYVGLAYVRGSDPATVDQTAGWSEAQKTEYQRTAPLGRTLQYRFVISTSGFGSNLPLYIIGTTNTGAVAYITKASSGLFRLGKGGSVPNPQYQFGFKNLINPQTMNRQEWVSQNTTGTTNPVTVVPGDPQNAFLYGDFSITNMKEWMDAVMTRFRELTGSSYWYTDSALLENPVNLFDTWFDAVGNVMTGTGSMSYNLILEATTPTYGRFQSKFTDSNILQGDSYVVGQTSGNSAVISSFNINQLVVNSLVKQDFLYDEVLLNRRLYRPNLSFFSLDDAVDGANRVAVLRRNAISLSGSTVAITAWSYSTLSPRGATVTVTAAGHAFVPGNLVNFVGLNCATNQPTGVHRVKAVTATTIVFDTVLTPTGTATVSSATAQLELGATHPYIPAFTITAWSFIGSVVTVTAPDHTYSTGDTIVFTGLSSPAANGRYSITVNSDRTITYTVGTAPSGTPTVTNAKAIADSATYSVTITGANPDDYNGDNYSVLSYDDTEMSYVLGSSALPALPTASGAIILDGVIAISTVANPVLINQIAYGNTPVVLSGSSAINNDVLTVTSTSMLAPGMTVTGPGLAPSTTVLSILSGTTVGLSSQALSSASGSYSFSSPYIEVTTSTAHGFSTIVGPISFTIYGDQTKSPYITTYSSVSLIYVSANVFRLVGQSVFNGGTYTNSGSDATYARFPNNPYPGPLLWDSDIIIKAIIGDKYFRIPQTATATGTDVANKFNINGQTGTAYLQDGEVAYIVLERNKSVALGSNYSTAGGSAPIIGAAPLTDENNQMLRIGDFLQFDGEDESLWYKISADTFSGLTEGDQLPAGTTTVYLIADNGQPVTLAQRPAKSGKLLYTKGTYDEIIVKKHWQVQSTPDIYWLAVRRDNGSLKSKIYLKALELEAGETRAINDNEPSNLLIYTGAGNEAAINPNYTVIDQSGSYQATQSISVGSYAADINTKTRQVTFVNAPDLGFQVGDKVQKTAGSNIYTYTVDQVLTSKTVIFKEDVVNLAPNDAVTYFRVNYAITDSDNLTLGIRKEDRELAKFNTALTRPIYDESIYPVLITLTPNTLTPTANTDADNALNADQILSGSYIYLGANPNNPSALAWVLHGTKAMSERIEGSLIGMPGAKFTENKILVHIINGTFPHNSTIQQVGRPGITRQIVNPGNPAFPSTPFVGSQNIELVLPPNRRTQVIGSEYIVWPSQAVYKASQDPALSGEELMVIANDSIREANLDYIETFGGPKAKIQIVRDMPLNSRFRFRILPAYGSALAKIAGSVTLQIAYDGGNQINTLTGRPVYINSIDRAVALKLDGTIEIDGTLAGNVVGGIMAATDQGFDIGSATAKPREVWAGFNKIKTHSTHSNSENVRFTFAGTTTTTAGTPMVGSNVSIDTDEALLIKVSGIARRSDATIGVSGFETSAVFYRNGAAAPVRAGSPYSLSVGNENVTSALVLTASGNDIVAIAYGVGIMEWSCTVEYQKVKLPT